MAQLLEQQIGGVRVKPDKPVKEKPKYTHFSSIIKVSGLK